MLKAWEPRDRAAAGRRAQDQCHVGTQQQERDVWDGHVQTPAGDVSSTYLPLPRRDDGLKSWRGSHGQADRQTLEGRFAGHLPIRETSARSADWHPCSVENSEHRFRPAALTPLSGGWSQDWRLRTLPVPLLSSSVPRCLQRMGQERREKHAWGGSKKTPFSRAPESKSVFA